MRGSDCKLLPMVYKLVKKYYLQDIPSLDWDDLNAIGLMSINMAIDKRLKTIPQAKLYKSFGIEMED